MAPHRDPETGQFVAGHDGMGRFDDIEVATFSASAGVRAADLTGATGFTGGDADAFEGIELIDYDEFVDRNEELVLLGGTHALTVYVNSTETADGTVSAAVEVSADPSLTSVTETAARVAVGAVPPDDAEGGANVDDSIDLIGRVLQAVGHAPFSDTATGVGGAGSAGDDETQIDMAPAEYGRFHPRDELFLNGQFLAWNIDDAAIHLAVSGQHVYGVLED